MNYNVYIGGFGKDDALIDEMFLGKFDDYADAAEFAHEVYDNPSDYLQDLNHRDHIYTFELGVYRMDAEEHLIQEYSLRKYA